MSILSTEDYEALLKPLTKELGTMARWVAETDQRVVVLFEGRDTAGKGGSIDMIARYSPAPCHVIALSSPSERERDMVFSALRRALAAEGRDFPVRPQLVQSRRRRAVMGYCSEREADAFLGPCPSWRPFVEDGILLFKYWLCCDQEKQEERFENRLRNPLKRWKLSPVDIEARDKYEAYTDAREKMLAATHTDYAPWTLVDFNDQALGRLTLLRDLLDRVPDTELPLKDISWPPLPGPPGKERFGVLEPIPNYAPAQTLRSAPKSVV